MKRDKELEANLARHNAETARLQGSPDPADVVNPSQVDVPQEVSDEELEAEERELEALDQASDQAEDRASSQSDRERIRRLEMDLQRTNLIIEKMIQQGYAIPDIVRAEQERQEREKKIAFYKSIELKEVTIQFHASEDHRKNFPVHICHNGNVWNLPRGIEVQVPGYIIPLLDDARVQGTVKEVNDEGNVVEKHYDYLSYPYVITRIGGDVPAHYRP